MTCTTCKRIQYLANDIAYLHLFGVCKDCDDEKWEKENLPMQTLEARVKLADSMTKNIKTTSNDTRIKT